MPQPVDDITYVNSALTKVLPRYQKVRDCVEQTVKDKATVYLPEPSTEMDATARAERYAAYLLRAVFYAVTARTLLGMVGQIYARPPQIQVPALLQSMEADATGSGLSLQQLSVDTMYDVMACGRAGLYVDYPALDTPATVAQTQRGEVKPTFTTYIPESIINWRTKVRGSKIVLSLVVLKETIDKPGQWNSEQIVQYRELRLLQTLVDGVLRDVYTVTVYQEEDVAAPVQTLGIEKSSTATTRQWKSVSVATPRDARGKPFDTIPFTFVGSMNNDAAVDELPLYDLAELNIAHYRNSADYEESCFIMGQPTPWFSGLTVEWVDEVLKGKVLLGSRSAVLLPENSQAGLLQVQANTMPLEAMKHKEAQMVALGARLVENRAVRRTLGEVQQSNASETSILASCANNVSAAYTWALQWACQFVGADPNDCQFSLNTDFALTNMSAEDRIQLVADLQAGVITFEEARAQLRRVGIATEDDTSALTKITKWLMDAAKRAVAAKPAAKEVKPKIDNRQKT